MRRGNLEKIVGSLALASSLPAFSQIVLINEFVVDPEQDRTGDGLITASDEFIELYNINNREVDLNGWKLELIDTTPVSKTLTNTIPARSYLLISNPVGSQNNSGEIRLVDGRDNLIDSVKYGDWPEATVQRGSATNLASESLSRHPLGSTQWVKTYATPGLENSLLSNLRIFTTNSPTTKIFTTNAIRNELVVQTSTDLREWTNIHTNSAASLLNLEIPVADRQRFYRVKEE